MATRENTLSVDAKHALWDMIELQMYLVAQSQPTPWSLLPRKTNRGNGAPNSYDKKVEFSVAKELFDRWFIEATSNRTYVVSDTGHQFYLQEVRAHSA
jgi:hypothetical protein